MRLAIVIQSHHIRGVPRERNPIGLVLINALLPHSKGVEAFVHVLALELPQLSV